jgi:branched-chain amino acid transport system substrate-binding protein
MKRLLLLAALGACTRGPSGGTVTFGAAGPWTQAYGEANKNGIQLALDEINASPAWQGGRRLDIVFADDSGNGVRASEVAQQFVDSARIVAVVGHVNSGAMVSAARVYDKHLAAVATTATSPSLTGISPWAFRVIPSDSANGMRIAQFANKLGRKRAAVLYENNPYGRGLADNFRKNFTGSIISIDAIGEGEEQTFEPFVSWYKRERPDVVFVAGTDASGAAFLKEARRQQLTADLVGGDGWQTLAPSSLAEGIYVGAPFSAQDPRPEVQTFVAAYQRKYHADPDGNAALAYDATKLLARAVEQVGANRVKIRDYLAGLTDASAYHGVTGTIRFLADGDPVGKGIVMTRVHRGALQVEAGQ